MSKTLKFKPDLKLAFLKDKRLELLRKEQEMGESCLLKDWFEINNKIRKINNEIMEIKKCTMKW